jgi:hypothetical protein
MVLDLATSGGGFVTTNYALIKLKILFLFVTEYGLRLEGDRWRTCDGKLWSHKCKILFLICD